MMLMLLRVSVRSLHGAILVHLLDEQSCLVCFWLIHCPTTVFRLFSSNVPSGKIQCALIMIMTSMAKLEMDQITEM